ncbi:MAG: helix-turn-helix domain-containing protein, partial [Bacteroidota bacterium]
QNAIKALNMHLSVGIHIGECLIINDQLEEGNVIKQAKEVQNLAKANQILVTQNIKNLLPTDGVKFSSANTAPTNLLLPPLFLVEDRYFEPAKWKIHNHKIPEKNGFLLENVIHCIDENLKDETFSVERLCKYIGLSERQLQRKLKAITNKSPNQIIRSVRLHRAKQLLLKKMDNIAEIAFQTGFSTPSYFSKCFKKEFGISPSELL